jgi:hypothetical protein
MTNITLLSEEEVIYEMSEKNKRTPELPPEDVY